MNTKKELETLGKSLIGKKAQSKLLTELTASGRQILSPAKVITAYEIVQSFMEPTLMVTIDGETIFEETLINIH